MLKRAIKKKGKNSNGEMGVIEHLSELRNRIFIVVTVFLIITVASFNFCDDLVDLLVRRANTIGYKMVYISPSELFIQYVRMSVIGGLVLSSPVTLFKIWLFVKPALKKNEKTIVFLFLLAGLVCFIIGAYFAFMVVVPFTLNFFISVDKLQSVQATITVQNYLNFVITTLITFGVIFEMPVLTVLLSQLGLLKPEWLVKSRRVVIVVVFIVAAVITPPDVISQILVAIPMLALFEVSTLLCKAISKRKKDREDDDEPDVDN
ncbi:MAG: twin-arginine translocase subunit TatC [Clostridiaceae bacterium]|nr:twin-arginine translocase subunit TatC [Clostridiaceae bacterium]